MSCDRFKEVDLAEYLGAPEAAAMAPFHAHVAECGSCRHELDAWRDMLGLLASGPPLAHPSPAALLRWVEARADLAAEEADRLAAHVDACRLCADELAALRSFDFARIAPAGDEARSGRRTETPRPSLLARPRELLGEGHLRPAHALVAAGVAAVALASWMLVAERRDAGPLVGGQRVARIEPMPPVATPEAKEASAELRPAPPPDARTAPPAADVVPSPPANALAAAPAMPSPAAPATGAARGRAAERRRDVAARSSVAPRDESAVARAVPAAPGATDAPAAAADAIVERFLGTGAARDRGGERDAGSTVGSSAVGFGSGERSDLSGERIAVLDETHRAVVPRSDGGVRLRVKPPPDCAPDAPVRVTVTAPDGSVRTVAARPRAGSAWHEAPLGTETGERGRYEVRVSAPDPRGQARSYDGVLEVR